MLLFAAASCGSPADDGKKGGYDLSDEIDLDDIQSAPDIRDARDIREEEDINTEPDTHFEEPNVEEAIGAPCADDDECPLGRCLLDEAFVDGYCSAQTECEYDDQCPEGTICQQYEGMPFCARRCDSEEDCRPGYVCEDAPRSPYKACKPEPEPPSLAVDGATCEHDSDCLSDTCLGDPEWPGGFCTTINCESRDDCQNDDPDGEVDNRCLQQEGASNLCVRMCRRQADCRDGYICQPIAAGQAICAPNPTADVGLDGAEEYPIPMTCGLAAENNQLDIDFEIAEDTTSYMISPIARDGENLMPLSLELPDQESLNFRGASEFQRIPAMLFGYLNPLVTPAIEEFEDQLQPGPHRLVLRTASQDICYYLFEESTPGTRIDLNIYLVGVGVNAEDAPEDPDFQAVLQAFDNIYTQADVQIGQVRYHDITGDDEAAFQVVRSDFDIQRLVALSELPEEADDALSVNIFFVRSMFLDEEGSAIGISQGLPGPAGVHGMPGSGVVFTSEYIGESFRDQSRDIIDGNEFTGIVMAHEVGHYLGLFHTSEQFNQGFDPISDTPECSPRDFPQRCPDLGNLMFPFADITHTELTPGQAHVIQVNPLTRD